WIRDVVTPGLPKTDEARLRNRFPVFAGAADSADGEVLFRYMRYWIETGQSKAGVPLAADEQRAFDLLDELLQSPENVVRFRLERGDVMFVNNRWLAHNRTAYVDTADNVRTLQRMWIAARRER
ncbi:MAG: TauD/TfdA family dioxygenase, partial [Planctomycetes bacterium]|nr:TauD/TfdA family dioxygenase [Planctomycetota bacterium]